MKVRHFLLTKNPGPKKKVIFFCLMYPDPEGRQCQSKLQKIKRLQFQNCSPGPQDTKNRHTTSELRIQGSEGPYKLSKYCHTPSLYSIGLIGNFVNAAHHTGLLKGAKDLTNQVL